MPADVHSSRVSLVACHECDQLQRLPSQQRPGRVRCVRCGCLLHHGGRDPVTVPLALGLAALLLWLLCNSFPLLDFSLQGHSEAIYLLAGIGQLFAQGQVLLALVVVFAMVLMPSLHILLLIYLYLPLYFDHRPPLLPQALRAAQAVLPWSMLEIFLLGVMVAGVKLSEQASIVPGPAFWSLAGLVLVLAAAGHQVHPRRLWERL